MPRTRTPAARSTRRVQRRTPRKAKTKAESYQAHLLPLMNYIHHKTFRSDHKWTRPELLALKPAKMMNYLKIKIYDDANADPDVVPPVRYRSNTIKSWKKAWSFFMVNKMTNWDEVTKRGNPTRCAEINGLIGSMIKMEVARRGLPSQARRALTADEYQHIIGQLGNGDTIVGAWLCAYFAFQLNLIARVDDTAKLRSFSIQPLHAFLDYGITVKLCWAKNCREERDAPTQIIFGAADWRYCVLSLLGVYLEANFEAHPDNDSEFVFDLVNSHCPIAIKESVSNHLRQLLQATEIDDLAAEVVGGIGTHSLRKFAVTVARSSGCSKDDVDVRGRWKSTSRQQDTYADTTIPYIDGKVAASLCHGGPIAYLVKEGSGVTDDWLLEHVVPRTAAAYPKKAAVVFGRAVLWKVFDASVTEDGESRHCIPATMYEQVMRAFNDLGDRNNLAAGENPVARPPLGVTGVDAQLIVDVIMTGDRDGGGGGGGGGGNGDWRVTGAMDRQEVRLLGSQILHLRREFSDLREQVGRGAYTNRAAFGRLSRTMTRLAASPAMRLVRSVPVVEEEEDTGDSNRVRAILMSRPKTCHDLWQDYMFGGPGRKPAKDFSPAERGRVKHLYSLRLPLCKKVAELVQAGVSATVACDKVYEAYGNRLPLSTILRKMKVDARSGNWPEVLVVRVE